MTIDAISPRNYWRSGKLNPAFNPVEIGAQIHRFRESAYIVQAKGQHLGVAFGGQLSTEPGSDAWPLWASVPPVFPEWLGDRAFNDMHGTRFPYVAGAMANGIATTRLVQAMGQAGMLGFFGAAGLPIARIEAAIDTLRRTLGDALPWGSNLIHSPNEPALEAAVADLYLRHGVHRVSAAAYMNLTPHIVRYAATGLHVDPSGQIQRRNYVFAKISHPDVAKHFLKPAPAEMLNALVAAGQLTRAEADLACRISVASDITAESDSGGHTDNRPLGALFPTITALRDELTEKYGYEQPIRVGAAGGLGTPASVASAFSLGAAYVVTGTVNQAAIESGLDVSGRKLLAEAGLGDVGMAPAADMFEQGVEVQVLLRGTMFAARARKLYALYKAHPSLDAIPTADRARLEKQVFHRTLHEEWASTRDFWLSRDPAEVERAERDPRHQMALVFRSYLGQASRWAIAGKPDRRADYQIWCGPAMGAFNRWVKGSFLEDPTRREAVQIALNLLEGAAAVTRAQQLRSAGVPVPASAFNIRPTPIHRS